MQTLRGLWTSRHSIEVPPSPSPGSPVELSSVACCRLEGYNGRFVAQCTIANLGERGRGVAGGLNALVTCHHAVSSMGELDALKLVLGTKERPVKYALGKYVASFISCCGDQGVWPKSRPHPQEPCPHKWNWTLLVLKPIFVTELCEKHRLTFLAISCPAAPSDAFKHGRRCHMFARRAEGDVFSQPVELKNPILQEASGQNCMEDEVNQYTQSSHLRYALSAFHVVEPGSAIVYCADPNAPETWQLLGIHSSCPPEEQRGASMMHVLDSAAIKDGKYCELVPCLSFLKQTLQHRSNQLATVASLQKLSGCLAMQRIKEEDALKEQKLLRLVQMLELVLSSTADQVNLHPQAGNYDGMKFLCDLFSCFEGLCHDSIRSAINEVPEVVRDTLVKQTAEICKQLFSLMDGLQESAVDEKMVEVAFELWLKMLHFSLCESLTDPLLNNNQGFEVVNRLRSWKRLKANITIQQLFGDISVMHQQKLRRSSIRDLELQKKKFEQEKEDVKEKLQTWQRREKELLAEVHELKGDKTELLKQNEELKEENKRLKEEQARKERIERDLENQLEEAKDRIDKMEHRQVESNVRPSNMFLPSRDGMDSAPMSPIVTPSTSTPMGSLDSKKLDDAYPTRSHRPSVCPEDAEDFWHKDILKLLSDDLKLRVDIADYFSKVTGASDGTNWEGLIKHLNLKMIAEQLETSPPGDILLAILKMWKKKDIVTVKRFCEVCNELGIPAVEKRLKMAEQKMKTSQGTCNEAPSPSSSSLLSFLEDTEGGRCSNERSV